MPPITILRTLGPALAKTWLADGTIAAYDDARQFHVREVPVADIGGLFKLLTHLQVDAQSCIVRGQWRNGKYPTLRNLDTFTDAPSHLFMVDVDNFAGTHEEFVATLPPCFQDTSYVLQYSGSYGHPSKPGLRAHLWFWLAEPMTCAQAEAWAKKWVPMADHTVHRTVQVNYTAAPLTRGTVDPRPMPPSERIRIVRGMLEDAVVVPADMPVPSQAEAAAGRASGKAGRKSMVDPRGKSGVFGAVARAWRPEQIVDLFPDLFEPGSKPERITWRAGGGGADGIRVADNGTHLFNSHATAPLQRAAPLFDFIRAHVHGHLDGDGDYELDVTAAPSYKATVEWALAQPEVQAELDPATPAARERTAQRIDDAKDARAAAALAAAAAPADAPPGEEGLSSEQLRLRLEKLIDNAESVAVLEHDLGRRVAKTKVFTPTERELIARAMQARSKVLLGIALPRSLIHGWIKPALPGAGGGTGFPHVGPNGEVLGTVENLAALCAQRDITVRYNEIAKDQEILIPGHEYTSDNRSNATFACLISAAAEVQMPHNAGQIKGYVTKLAGSNVYSPVLDWIGEAPWDGRSRIDELFATLTLAPGSDVALARLMLRKWLIQAVAAAASRELIQTRGVLVLQGPQYIGKSRWVERLCLGHDDLVATGRSLDPHNKDSVKACIRRWIVELGELDGSLSRSHIASIKSFISDREDTLRLPYATGESIWPRRTVWAASVNTEEFLVDNTGNTRFWTLSVERLDPDHGVDMQQVWAEVMLAYEAGEPHWLEQGEMARVETNNAYHEAVPALEQVLLDRFPWEEAAAGHAGITWAERSTPQIATLCGVMNLTDGVSRGLGAALSKLMKRYKLGSSGSKLTRMGGKKTRLRSVPMRTHDLELNDLEAE